MDAATISILTPIAGVAIPSVFTYLGVRLGNRLERHKLSAATPERVRNVYEGAIDALQEQLDELRKDRSVDREEVTSLRTRVVVLEEDRVRDRRRIDDLIAYVRVLQRMLREARIPYPHPPPGLELLDDTADAAGG